MSKQKLTPWMKDALKVSELEYQLYDLDLADGQFASEEELLQASAEYLVEAARWRLDVAMDPYNQDEASWRKDAAQLRKFIKKWAA